MPDKPAGTGDRVLRESVLAALDAALDDDATTVGVAVSEGCVLLTGTVPAAADRAAAVTAAFGVDGVTTVHDAIAVRLRTLSHADDVVDLTHAVAAAIAWATIEPDAVRAEIWDGTVVLTGQVEWDVERRDVCRAVRLVHGVDRVDDRIRVIRPRTARPA
jgi:osmotically-inducible protein OsmY